MTDPEKEIVDFEVAWLEDGMIVLRFKEPPSKGVKMTAIEALRVGTSIIEYALNQIKVEGGNG